MTILISIQQQQQQQQQLIFKVSFPYRPVGQHTPKLIHRSVDSLNRCPMLTCSVVVVQLFIATEMLFGELCEI